MKRTVKILNRALLGAALLVAAEIAVPGNALALDRRGYSMEVLIGGNPVTEYPARGANYIEALKRREYSVRLRNRTAERIAIALSVDGLNSIDARTTTARDARKWVLGPYESIIIDGWQVSSASARKFFFTSEEKSYGAWLGKTSNLGLIAAAVFREKRRPVSYDEQNREVPYRQQEGNTRDGDESSAPAPDDSFPMGQSERSRKDSGIQSKKSDELAATGIGEEVNHPVQQVSFHSEDAPAALLELRYEYRDSLVRLGVLPAFDPCDESLSRREKAHGFTEPGFAPDPFRPRGR